MQATPGIRLDQLEAIFKERGILDRIFLIGPPGIGKTELVREAAELEAKREGRVFVDLREEMRKHGDEVLNKIIAAPSRHYVFYRIIATHIFPEDIQMPDKRPKWVEHLSPKVLFIFTLPNIKGVLFIDEITNIQRLDQAAMYFSMTLEREFGWSAKLSPGVKLVAAGNPPEVSSAASRGLPAPLLNGRLLGVRVEPPTVKAWRAYMDRRYGDGWDRRTLAYLLRFEGDIYQPPDAPEGFEDACFPSPRSWTRVALLLAGYLKGAFDPKNKNEALDALATEIILHALGPKVGSRFIEMLRSQPPPLEKLLEEPDIWHTLKLPQKLLLCYEVANNVDLIIQRGEKLVAEIARNDREMLMLIVKTMKHAAAYKFIDKYIKYLRDVMKDITSWLG